MKSILVRATIALILAIRVTVVLAADQIQVVAFSGNPAPGTPAGVKFTDFGPPALNDSGETAFLAQLAGLGVFPSTSLGFWSNGGGGGRRLVPLQSAAVPGGAFVKEFLYYTLNDVGQTAFRASLFGPTLAHGIWSEGGGQGLQLVAQTGSAMPGFASGVKLNLIFGPGFFPTHQTPVLNNHGKVVFQGSVVGPGVGDVLNDDSGVWEGTSLADLEPIMAARDTQTGYANGADYFSWNNPTLNDAGQIAFGGATTTERHIAITMPNGSTRKVAIEGRSSPDFPATIFTSLVRPPTLNNSGHIVFSAGSGGGNALYSEGRGSGLSVVAGTNMQAPKEAGRTFDQVEQGFINHGGQVAFTATIKGPGIQSNVNDKGIWKQDNSFRLSEVMLQGTQAPGAPAGALFGRLNFPTLVFNRWGQVAFYNVMSNGSAGIWAQDITGILRPIVIEGVRFDVDPGLGVDFRTVAQIDFFAASGNEDGLASGFNEKGQVAFNATFTDGSAGVFISNVVAVPEPRSLALIAMTFFSNRLGVKRRSASSV